MATFSSLISCCVSPSTDEVQDETFGTSNVRRFTYKELNLATENFSVITKIGEGGFGPVYQGRLKNRKMAAIKVLSENSRQGVKEFLSEIEAMSSIQHENLVSLYGCCVEEDKRILVYNYLENNSLQQALLGDRSRINLPWETRYRIGLGVAKGLAFLHEEVRPHIIHRDIKASNILLDKDFNPKISDFGLARLISPDKTHVSTRVAGTVGYVAPEYAVNGRLTRKADIYSFGVLLLEIAWQLHEKRTLITLVDERLEGVFDAEEAYRVLTVALLCTQESPKLRPQMSAVVRFMAGEKKLDDNKITKPGIIDDLVDMKVRDTTKIGPRNRFDTKGSSSSSGSYNLEHSTFSWANAP